MPDFLVFSQSVIAQQFKVGIFQHAVHCILTKSEAMRRVKSKGKGCLSTPDEQDLKVMSLRNRKKKSEIYLKSEKVSLNGWLSRSHSYNL